MTLRQALLLGAAALAVSLAAAPLPRASAQTAAVTVGTTDIGGVVTGAGGRKPASG